MTSLGSPNAQKNSGNSVPPQCSSLNAGRNIPNQLIPAFGISPSSNVNRSTNGHDASVQNCKADEKGIAKKMFIEGKF
jgi:hypothetical protein